MKAILIYPKDKKFKGRISPYYNRLNLKHSVAVIVEGEKDNLETFKSIVERYGGKLILPK